MRFFPFYAKTVRAPEDLRMFFSLDFPPSFSESLKKKKTLKDQKNKVEK